MKLWKLTTAALLVATSIQAKDFGVGDLKISQPLSHAMVPGAKVGDGYFKVTNSGPTPDKLVAVTSPNAAAVQLHSMKMDNGVMTMREVRGGLDIPPGQTVDLEPHYHMMFMDPKKPFRQGDKIPATLTFEKAGRVDVVFEVGKIAGPLSPTDDQSHKSMKMQGMDMPGMDMSK